MARWCRRVAGPGIALVSLIVWAAAASWACVPIATVSVTPAQARPGDEVQVSGIRFVMPTPVVLRFGSTDGPILVTIEMPRSANTLFSTKVRVPTDARPGPLVVVAMQEAVPESGGAPWGVPARAIITVLDAQGNAPPSTVPSVAGRAAAMSDETVNVALAVFIAVGVAAGVLLLVGGVAAIAGRRPKPRPAPVQLP